MTYFRSLNKHIAFLLLLIFTAVQVIQCVHNHSEDVAAISHVKDSHHSTKADLHKAEVKCKVCDFIRDQQTKKYYTHQQVPVTIFNTKGLTLSIDFSESLFERCVHTWTNKGPPLV